MDNHNIELPIPRVRHEPLQFRAVIRGGGNAKLGIFGYEAPPFALAIGSDLGALVGDVGLSPPAVRSILGGMLLPSYRAIPFQCRCS